MNDIKISKRGHSMNLEYANRLLMVCRSLGPRYQPAAQHLQLSQLEQLLQQCVTSNEAVETARRTYSALAANREEKFNRARNVSMRMLSFAESGLSLNSEQLKDLKSLMSKIYGRTKKKPAKTTPLTTEASAGELPSEQRVRSAQQGFIRRYENLKGFAELLKQYPYAPAETELTISSFEDLLVTLKQINDNMALAANNFYRLKSARNELMYLQGNNLIDSCNGVKKYLKAVFGYNSSQHRAATRFSFIRYKS